MKRVIVTGMLLVLCIPLVGVAQNNAQTDRETFEQKLEEKRAAREAQLQAQDARACTRQELRIDLLVERFEFVHDRRETRFQRIVDVINNAILRIEDSGLEATSLKTTLTTLNQQLVAVNATQADLESQLHLLATSACIDNSEEFRTQLQTARTALRSLREADRTAVQTVRQDVVSTLVELRTSVDEDSTNTDNGEEVDSE